MKEEFLELVNEVKDTGIVEILEDLYDASDKEGFKAAWQKFSDENQEIFTKIRHWANDLDICFLDAIFEENETIENPIENAICIFIIGNQSISEVTIFEDWIVLQDAIRDLKNGFATAIANFMEESLICEITIEDIFNSDSDDEEESEDVGN